LGKVKKTGCSPTFLPSLLNSIDLELEEGDLKAKVNLHYRPDCVFFVDRETSSKVVYEASYYSGVWNLPLVQSGRNPSKISGSDPSSGEYEIGQFGPFEYTVTTIDGDNLPLIDFSSLDRLEWTARAYSVRAYAEQLVNGKWLKLTPIRFEGQAFLLAPQDTIQLRAKFQPILISYFPDRVEVENCSGSCPSGIEVEIRRPQTGYWPRKRPQQEFFINFSRQRIDCGEWMYWKYFIKPPTRIYTLDVYPHLNDETASLQHTVTFIGPNMWIPEDNDRLSFWPLVPKIFDGEVKKSENPGYPGGLVVPPWAAKKLLELGRGFTTANSKNKEKYLSH
jgi:hypothetical protein